jgi:hypothetical protein
MDLISQLEKDIAALPGRRVQLNTEFDSLAYDAVTNVPAAVKRSAEITAELAKLDVTERQMTAALEQAKAKAAAAAAEKRRVETKAKQDRDDKLFATAIDYAHQWDKLQKEAAPLLAEMVDAFAKTGLRITFDDDVEKALRRTGQIKRGANPLGTPFTSAPKPFFGKQGWHDPATVEMENLQRQLDHVEISLPTLAESIKSGVSKIKKKRDAPPEPVMTKPAPEAVPPPLDFYEQLRRPWAPQHTLPPKDVLDAVPPPPSSPLPPGEYVEVQPPGPRKTAAEIQAGIRPIKIQFGR